MKWLFAFAVVLMVGCSPVSHIYIVRHAEKASNDPKDPELTSAGIARANALGLQLRDKGISKIYSTNFKRTMATAKPLGDFIHVPVEVYKNDTAGRMLNNIVKSRKNALVVAHSNTTVSMLDSLHVPHVKKVIPDGEYDNLFIVTVKKGAAVKVDEKKYGAPSPAAN